MNGQRSDLSSAYCVEETQGHSPMFKKIVYAVGSAAIVLVGISLYIAFVEDEDLGPPEPQGSLTP